MASEAEEGEGMMVGKICVTLDKAMGLAREKSKLEKRHARYKRYYDCHPDAMQKKKTGTITRNTGTLSVRGAGYQASERRRMNTVTGFVHHHPIFDQNPGSSATPLSAP